MAIDPETGKASKLFHPREQVWDNHFEIQADATIKGLIPEGRTTVSVLRINDEERVRTRHILMLAENYPC